MAVKRQLRKKQEDIVSDYSPVNDTADYKPTSSANSAWNSETPAKRKMWVNKKLILLGLSVLALLGLWWYKTNTWPIVAVVGWKPITRYEVDQTLFKANGPAVIDSLITQKAIEAELDKQNVTVESKDVDAKLEEVKLGFGEGVNFEDELKNRGMTIDRLRGLIELQLRLDKAVGDTAVTDEDINKYVQENGQYLTATTEAQKKEEARFLLQDDKRNSSIEEWVEKAKANVRTWRLKI